jgi:hypothetical protein
MPLTNKQREMIVAWAHWGAKNHVGYSDGPDKDDWRTQDAALPLTTDNAGFPTFCYFHAGADDPTGQNYRVAGYTGTMLDYMKHISWATKRPGDLCVYGPGTGRSVAIFIQSAGFRDSLMVWHGGTGIGYRRQSLLKEIYGPGAQWLTLP